MNVYLINYGQITESVKAGSHANAAIFFVKHRVLASKYKCKCKTVGSQILYIVQADNFYYQMTVTLIHMQMQLL